MYSHKFVSYKAYTSRVSYISYGFSVPFIFYLYFFIFKFAYLNKFIKLGVSSLHFPLPNVFTHLLASLHRSTDVPVTNHCESIALDTINRLVKCEASSIAKLMREIISGIFFVSVTFIIVVVVVVVVIIIIIIIIIGILV